MCQPIGGEEQARVVGVHGSKPGKLAVVCMNSVSTHISHSVFLELQNSVFQYRITLRLENV